MTILERPSADPAPDDPAGLFGDDGSLEAEPAGPARAAVVGAVTALGSLAVPVVVALLSWLLDERSAGSPWSSVSAGASFWLLGHGVSLGGDAGNGALSIAPLLLTGGAAVLAWFGVREAVRGVAADGDLVAGLLRAPILRAVLAWWAGYALVTLLAVALATRSALPPRWLTVPIALLVIPGLALATLVSRLARDEPHTVGERLRLAWLPVTVRRGIGPGLQAAGALVAFGVVLVAVAVGLSWDEVSHVHAAVGAGGVGSAVLIGAQVGYAPNVGMWAASFLAGPGFQVVDGASTTWSGSRGGLLPLIPVFAALPQPGDFPALMPVVALVPVLAGAYGGHRAVRAVARLSSVRTKLEVALAAALTAALALGLVDLFAGGAMGTSHLADMGVPAGWFVLALAFEFSVGAVLAALLDSWRLRR